MDEEIEGLVCNDAGAILTDDMKLALTRGLSFIPRRSFNREKLGLDLEGLRRRINLRLFWNREQGGGGQPKTSMMSRILRSEWEPPEALRSDHALWQELLTACTPSGKVGLNIPSRALQAWRDLMNDERWYVLKADKGGKIVIWGREFYKKEALRQLLDRETYEELSKEQADAFVTSIHREKVAITLDLEKSGCMTKAERKRVLEEKVGLPGIYFLPKIHKEKDKVTGGFKGRPITAAVGNPMKSLDEYLAKLTAVLLRHIPGSLMDTGALLRDLESLPRLPPNARLFSADVEGLYPSIEWQEAVDSATEFYEEKLQIVIDECNRNNMLPPPKPATFRRILKTILENNVIHFQNERWFRQLKGTAMGCSMSVFIANTFMYRRMRSLIERPPPGLLYLGRYIDDIIAIWCGDKKSVPGLFSEVIDKNIKFTYVFGGLTLEALDILIIIQGNGSVITRLYRKPTEGTQYTHWSSAHPVSLKRSIPYAQLLRLKRNCSLKSDFLFEARVLLDKFRDRGYPEDVLEKALSAAQTVDRKALLDTGSGRAERGREDRLVLVADFHEPLVGTLRNSISNFHEKLLGDPIITERVEWLGPQLPERPPRVAFRAGGSLGSALGPIFKKGKVPPAP